MSDSPDIHDHDEVRVNGVVFTHRDIELSIDDFYTRIQQDPILAVPFQSVHDWPEHVRRLTHFWWIRFGGKPYMFSEYNPVWKHYYAGFNEELLVRWLRIFHETLALHLSDQQYQLWKMISERMGEGLLARNEMIHQEKGPPEGR